MTILIAEDSPIFRRMLENMLDKWGYHVMVARDGIEAWQVLQSEQAPDLAILDWMMPGMDGVEVCRRIRQIGREPYIYVLLLTGKTEQKDVVEGMEAGADDYLTKPFDAHELRVRLRAGQRILELQAELVRAREALREQATHDGLTGFWTRNATFEILQRELSRVKRESSCLAVLMADIDNFKKVNDVFGHLAGDQVLQETARRLRMAVRSYDAIGRYGGEEFLIVLPGCDARTGAMKAERLRQSVSSAPFQILRSEIEITCSLGVVSTADAYDSDSLIRMADTALYVAKAKGRNRVELAQPEVGELATDAHR